MKNTYTPLRYPGGKSKLAKQFEVICKSNNIDMYVEPYAGGFGIGLYLLLNNVVKNVIINDIDPLVHSFWYSILKHNKKFINMIYNTDITMDNWYKYKEVIKNHSDYDKFTVGFATFFMNRTNRSGIIKAGVIGGKNQNSSYKLDVRFNKSELANKIYNIGQLKNHIILYNIDAVEMMQNVEYNKHTLIYIDPPYYNKADSLYNYYYQKNEHKALSEVILKLNNLWILSYDNNEYIRQLYNNSNQAVCSMYYGTSHQNQDELFIYNTKLLEPVKKSL